MGGLQERASKPWDGVSDKPGTAWPMLCIIISVTSDISLAVSGNPINEGLKDVDGHVYLFDGGS